MKFSDDRNGDAFANMYDPPLADWEIELLGTDEDWDENGEDADGDDEELIDLDEDDDFDPRYDCCTECAGYDETDSDLGGEY